MITPSLNERLRAAIEQGRELQVCRILDAGADPNGESGTSGAHMLEYALAVNASVRICQLLIQRGAHLTPDSHAGRLLSTAATSGSPALCAELIRHGVDVRAVNPEGTTALHSAAGYGHASVCAYLIAAGADVNVTTKQSLTPLHQAVRCWRHDLISGTVQLLIERGAQTSFMPPRPKKWYLTPFQTAVRDAELPIVSYLIKECGEDPFQITLEGKSMAEIAGKENVQQFFRMLATERRIEASLGADKDSGSPSQWRKLKLDAL